MISSNGYDLDTTVSSFTATQKDYAQRSKTAARLPGAALDLSYGDHPRQKIDVFPISVKAPVILFLRGGYWKLGSKEDRRFPASVWRNRGVAWAVPNYRLSPIFTLDEIVEDARNGLIYLSKNADQFNVDPKQVHLVGNSAGAHLAAMLAADVDLPQVASLTLISGLFDLVPLIKTEANSWLGLEKESARRLSPIHQLPHASVPIIACCGDRETDAFKYQTKLYADACRSNGNAVTHFESPGKDHIGIIGECSDPGTPVFSALERHIKMALPKS